MQIELNGKIIRLASPIALSDFLQSQGIDPQAGHIALALNEKIAKRSEWATICLKEGDRIELIHAVQGG